MHEDAMTRLRLALKLEVSLVARHARLRMSAELWERLTGPEPSEAQIRAWRVAVRRELLRCDEC